MPFAQKFEDLEIWKDYETISKRIAAFQKHLRKE